MRKTIVVLSFSILFLLLFSIGSAQSLKATIPLGAVSNFYIITKIGSETQENLSLSFEYIQVDNNMPPRVDHSGGPAYFFGVAMGDLTSDGYKDIVAHKMFYRNPGGNMQGIWQRVTFPWDWTDAFAIVDIDGDQYGDVIAEGEQVNNNVNIYWLEAQNTAGTSWSRVLIGIIPQTEHLWSQEYEVAQIVSGGKPEILIGGGDGVYYFSIPANPASGNWPRVKIIDNGYGYATGDINGDGYLDVAGAYDSTNVAWWKNPGDGSGYWIRYAIGQTNYLADRFAIADIDRDGRNDIVVSEEVYPVQSGSRIFWFKANSDPRSDGWVRNTVVSDAWSLNSMSVADMDNDGDMDIVSGEMGNLKRMMVFENDGSGNFENHVVDTGKESHLGARVADLDGDGDLDIISIGWNEYQYVHVWRNDAEAVPVTPEFIFEHVIVSSTDYANVRSIGDVDGDGFPDIIAAKDGSGLTWYKYPNWTKYSIQSFNWRADDIHSADIDGDGDVDVVGVQDDDGKVYWFENPRPSGNPADTWISHYIGSNNDFVKDLEIADFNRDGKLDVVTRTSNTTSVFLQNNATSWNKIKTINHHELDGLDVGDLDGDGDADIVLNGFWLENPYPTLSDTWYEHNIDSKRWNQSTGQWQDNNAKVRVVDINKDGRLDVLISQSEKPSYPVSWYEASNPKNGSWTEHVIGYFDYCHTLQAGDMDNDGDIDVVVGKFERHDGAIPPPYPIMVYYNTNGDGLSWNVTEVSDLGIYTGVIGDIGNDGDLDIVGSRSYWKGPIEIWENKPTATNTWTVTPPKVVPVVSTSITVSLSKDTINKGESVAVHAKLGIPDMNTTVTFVKPDNTHVQLNATTDIKGAFDVTYTPDVAGNWTVAASFDGYKHYAFARSPDMPLKVVEQQPPPPPPPPATAGIPMEYVYAAVATVAIVIVIAAGYMLMKRRQLAKP